MAGCTGGVSDWGIVESVCAVVELVSGDTFATGMGEGYVSMS